SYPSQPTSPIEQFPSSPLPPQTVPLGIIEISPTTGILTPRQSEQAVKLPHEDWGEAPHLDQFYGREKELVELEQWIVGDRCRLVAVLGIGGIGKTALT